MSINKVKSLMKRIGEKHNTYCVFAIKSGHVNGDNNYAKSVDYETYIADDPDTHVRHKYLTDALGRFENYLNIENLLEHNKEMAEYRLENLLDRQGNINDEINTVRKYLEES